jgi:hypothetical protein
MASLREEIEEILVDCYGEGEQMSAWEVAFTDGVAVPLGASLPGVPVEVQGFRINNANLLSAWSCGRSTSTGLASRSWMRRAYRRTSAISRRCIGPGWREAIEIGCHAGRVRDLL